MRIERTSIDPAGSADVSASGDPAASSASCTSSNLSASAVLDFPTICTISTAHTSPTTSIATTSITSTKLRRSRRHQSGVTLIESLVAFAVVSLGTVSVIRLQRDLRFNADLSSQRAEASHLGQGTIEQRRAAAGFETPAAVSTTTTLGRNTRFTVATANGSIDVDASAAALMSVSVSWPDIAGGTRAISLDTVVGSASPALSAALSIRAIDASAGRLANRAVAVPVDMKNLGNGFSAWKPVANDSTVWLFDNTTGRIASRCLGTSSSLSTQDLTTADLSSCSVSTSTLLSGIVRTSLATPPDISQANDLPAPMNVKVALSVPAQSESPPCVTEAQRSVEAVFGSGVGMVLRREAVALTATAASIGATSWTDLGDRFLAYRCVVPDPPGGWSGHTTIVPTPPLNALAHTPDAWAIGSSAAKRKVCRYETLSTGGPPADANAAHPATYVGVNESLAQQNFLIVRGDQSCPGPSVDGLVSTAQQQP